MSAPRRRKGKPAAARRTKRRANGGARRAPAPPQALVRAPALDRLSPVERARVEQAIASAGRAPVVVVVVNTPAPASLEDLNAQGYIAAGQELLASATRDLVGELRYVRGHAAPEGPTLADLRAREIWEPPDYGIERWQRSTAAENLFAGSKRTDDEEGNDK